MRHTQSEEIRIVINWEHFHHHLSLFLPRTQAQELAVLISRMQKNADQVEKNILQAEKLLAVVRSPDES